MSMKNKIIAIWAAAVFVVTAGVTAAVVQSESANAFYNKVTSQYDGCIHVKDGPYYYSTCGYGAYFYDFDYIRIPQGTCRFVGDWWSYKYRCASSTSSLLIPTGGGLWYVK